MPRTSSAASSAGFLESFSSSLSSLLPPAMKSYFINNKDRIELIGKGLEPAENIDDSPLYGDIENGPVHQYLSQRDLQPVASGASQHEHFSNHNMSEDQNYSNNDHSFQSYTSGVPNQSGAAYGSSRPAPMLSSTNRSLTSPALLASLKINDKAKNKDKKKRVSSHFSQFGSQIVGTSNGAGNVTINLPLSLSVGADEKIKRAISDDDDDPEASSMSAYMGSELRLLSQKARHRSMDETQMRKSIFNKSFAAVAKEEVSELTSKKDEDLRNDANDCVGDVKGASSMQQDSSLNELV